jgi:50S ribosomal subunit-associated GTPase HflX
MLVLNKIDLVPEEQRAQLPRGTKELPAVAISAQDRTTVAPLLDAMERALWREGRMERPMEELEPEAHPS